MSNARAIFGAHESDSGHRETDAEDHESDARFSGAHGMFGSSDRLFVGDLDGELAMLAGGDLHGNFALHGGDLHASSIRDAPRRDDLLLTPTPLGASCLPDRSGTPLARAGAGASATAQTKRKAAAAPSMPALSDDDDGDVAAPGAGFNTRAGDELPERSADRLEGVGAAHAALPMAATAPLRRSAFLAATAQMAPAAGPRRNLESQKGAASTARASDRSESAVFSSSGSDGDDNDGWDVGGDFHDSAVFSSSGSDDDDNDGWDGRTSLQARGGSGSAAPGLQQNRRPQKDAAHTARASERRARTACLKASRNRRIGDAKRRAVAASVLKLVEKRAAEQPSRAAASQRAAQARASDDAPPLVVGPATVDRIVAGRDVPGASDRALLRRRLDGRTTSGAAASDASTRLVQILQRTAAGLQAGAPLSAALDQLGKDGAAVAVSAVSKANYRSYQSSLSVFHQTMTQIFGAGVLPDISGGIEVLQTTPMHGALIAMWLEMVACDLIPRGGVAANGVAKGGATFSRIAGLEDKPYTWSYVRWFLDGVSGWHRAHGLLVPMKDPAWTDIIARARKLAHRLLDSGRSFRAESLSPLMLMVLLETNSPLSNNEVQFAALQLSALAYFMRPSEWWFLDREALAFVSPNSEQEFMHLLFEVSKGDEFSQGVHRLAAHRPGCTGSSEKPCIVLTPQGNIHGVFGCVVCMMAYHLRLRRITTGPVFRHPENPDLPIPTRAVTSELRKRMSPLQDAAKAAGLPALKEWNVRAAGFRRSATSTAEQALDVDSKTVTWFGRWKNESTKDLYNELRADRVRECGAMT